MTEWQLIETAPNNKKILVVDEKGRRDIAWSVLLNCGERIEWVSYNYSLKPVKCKPLDDPPEDL